MEGAGADDHAVKAGGGEEARIGAVAIEGGAQEAAEPSGIPDFQRSAEIGVGARGLCGPGYSG